MCLFLQRMNKIFFQVTDTFVLLSLCNIQLSPRVEHGAHHLEVKALRISHGLLQLPPLSSRERPVRRLHPPCETFRLQSGKKIPNTPRQQSVFTKTLCLIRFECKSNFCLLFLCLHVLFVQSVCFGITVSHDMGANGQKKFYDKLLISHPIK